MEAKRRQQRLLGGLLVVLAVVAGYEFLARPAATAVPASNGVRAVRARAGQHDAAATETVPRVALDALRQKTPAPLAAGRNLFQFGAAPVAAAGPGRGPGIGPGGSGLATRASAPRPTLPVTPPIPLKFIGILEAPAPMGRVAVLSDGHDVYHGHEGDIIEGRYRIVRIGIESIEMAHLDGSGRQMIRLTGGS